MLCPSVHAFSERVTETSYLPIAVNMLVHVDSIEQLNLLLVTLPKILTLNIGYQPYEYSISLIHCKLGRGWIIEPDWQESKLYTLCSTLQYSRLARETEKKSFESGLEKRSESAEKKKK